MSTERYYLWSVGRSEVGPVRELNEDACYHGTIGAHSVYYQGVSPDNCAVLVVCDGMGGHAAGEVASSIARDMLVERLADLRRGRPEVRMEAAIRAAHAAVVAAAREMPERKGMGTTCVAALIAGDTAVVGNVGDSRAILVRGGRYSQVSKDHTRAMPLLEQGIINREQYDNHPDRSVLAQALGQEKEPVPFIETVRMQSGDTLILCSDGVYETLNNEEIAFAARHEDPAFCRDELVELALKRDGNDNTTAVVARLSIGMGDKVMTETRGGPKRGILLSLLATLGLVCGAFGAGWFVGYDRCEAAKAARVLGTEAPKPFREKGLSVHTGTQNGPGETQKIADSSPQTDGGSVANGDR